MPITQDGETYQVFYDSTDLGTDEIDFIYEVDFSTPGWTGSPNSFLISVDFGLTEPKVDSVLLNSTTAPGTWMAGTGASNANGCGGGSSVFACAENSPVNAAPAAGKYTFDFTVTFNDVVSEGQVTDANNHIGAFFTTCKDPADVTTCRGGGQGLSEEISFDPKPTPTPSTSPDPTPPPNPMPLPGTLALMGLGLLLLRKLRLQG